MSEKAIKNTEKAMRRRLYAAPRLTVVSFKMERGYASSLSDVANELNSWANEQVQRMGELNDDNLWRASQDVTGVGNESEGLNAGYFYQQQTDGWF